MGRGLGGWAVGGCEGAWRGWRKLGGRGCLERCGGFGPFKVFGALKAGLLAKIIAL